MSLVTKSAATTIAMAMALIATQADAQNIRGFRAEVQAGLRQF